ncbi:MAG: hypothetical protein COA78_13370 [Blastopirellula sp.]|nr:MAG: hypothetical protein COA78_13370 [Blastopirellula sp.]
MTQHSDDLPSETKKMRPRRRWYQFSLGSILILITSVAVGSAYYRSLLNQCRDQVIAAQKLEAIGAEVTYQPAIPSWLSWLPEADRCIKVTIVDLEHKEYSEGSLAPLAELHDLERLYLARSSVTDKDLISVSKLYKVRRVSLWGTQLSNECFEHFKQMRQLELLDIQQNPNMDEQALHYLQYWPKLRLLKMRSGVTDSGLKLLVAHPFHPVEMLAASRISDEGMEDLLKLQRIRYLSISPECSKENVQRLVEMPMLNRLGIYGRMDVWPKEFQEKHPQINFWKPEPLRNVPLIDIPNQWSEKCQAIDIDTITGRPRGPTGLLITLTLEDPTVKISIDLGKKTGFSVPLFNRFKNVKTITIAGRKTIADFQPLQFPKLEELNLHYPLTNKLIHEISQIKTLKHLSFFASSSNREAVDDEVWDSLASLENLETLSIHQTFMKEHHLQFISNCPKLRRVFFCRQSITGITMKRVSELPNLDEFVIQHCYTLKREDLEWIRDMKRLRTCKMNFEPEYRHISQVRLPIEIKQCLPLLEDNKDRVEMYRRLYGPKSFPKLPPLED